MTDQKPLVKLDPEHERMLVELERAAIQDDRRERAEHHATYMRFMEKQLRSMDEATAHNAHQRECAAREAAALERIVALLEKADARAEDRRVDAVMD